MTNERVAEMLGIDEIRTMNNGAGLTVALRLGEDWMSTDITLNLMQDMRNMSEAAAKVIFDLAGELKRRKARRVNVKDLADARGVELDEAAELLGIPREPQPSNRFEAVVKELMKL